jgi:hypothetical protein
MIRATEKFTALKSVNDATVCFPQPSGRLEERNEHRLQVEGGAADHLEYVGGGGLLLQRFRQIIGTLSQLFGQAGVLDGDDGLVGEIVTSSICLSVNGHTS